MLTHAQNKPSCESCDAEREQLLRWVSRTWNAAASGVALPDRSGSGSWSVPIWGLSAECGIDVKTVALWRGRFAEMGPEGLWEIAPGRGRKAELSVR